MKLRHFVLFRPMCGLPSSGRHSYYATFHRGDNANYTIEHFWWEYIWKQLGGPEL